MTKTQAYLQFIQNFQCTCMTKRPEAQYHKKDCPMNSPDNPFQKVGEVFQLTDGCIYCGPFSRAYCQRHGSVVRNWCTSCEKVWETDVYSPYRERIATEATPKAEISALQCEVTRLDSHIEEPPEPLKRPRKRMWRWLEVIAEGLGGLARGLS